MVQLKIFAENSPVSYSCSVDVTERGKHNTQTHTHTHTHTHMHTHTYTHGRSENEKGGDKDCMMENCSYNSFYFYTANQSTYLICPCKMTCPLNLNKLR